MTAATRVLAATWLHDYLTTDPPDVPSIEDIADETGDDEILNDPDAAAVRDLAAGAIAEGATGPDIVGALRFPDGSRLLIMCIGADEYALEAP